MFLTSIPGVLQTQFADHLVLFTRTLALLDALLSMLLTYLFRKKNWDSLQIKQGSTWRELHCVSFALKSFAHLLLGCFVKWFTDSQAVSLIVDSGSMKEHLHQLVVDIFHTAKENNIEIEVEWIPRSLNKKAD